LALSLGDAVIKAAGLELPLWQMYILRSALVVPPLWWLARRNGARRFGSMFWVIVRSMLLVVMWLSYYSALPLMPLSLAAAAYYTAPILITIVASVLARRWPTPRVLFAIFMGFAGVILCPSPLKLGH
jgi:drug/metabolite transporter (DMT)-like permease